MLTFIVLFFLKIEDCCRGNKKTANIYVSAPEFPMNRSTFQTKSSLKLELPEMNRDHEALMVR